MSSISVITAHRKFLSVSPQHSLQIQLLDLALQTGRKARVHGASSGQDDVLVEVRPSDGR